MAERLSTDDLARREVTPDRLDDAPRSHPRRADDHPEAAAPEPQLLDTADSGELRERWGDIQTGFVDEPRRAVEEADALVADLMRAWPSRSPRSGRRLEGQWDRGDEVSTEELRVALQRYRSFFDRLLAA